MEVFVIIFAKKIHGICAQLVKSSTKKLEKKLIFKDFFYVENFLKLPLEPRKIDR